MSKSAFDERKNIKRIVFGEIWIEETLKNIEIFSYLNNDISPLAMTVKRACNCSYDDSYSLVLNFIKASKDITYEDNKLTYNNELGIKDYFERAKQKRLHDKDDK